MNKWDFDREDAYKSISDRFVYKKDTEYKFLSLSGDFVSSLYLALYILKKWSVTIIKLCKSIFDEFAHKKNTWYKFGLSINRIFVGEMSDNFMEGMRNNKLNISGGFL